MKTIMFVWYLINGTIVPQKEVDGRQCYRVNFPETTEITEGNKTFCIAPWSHTYLSPQSERRLCCASREKASWATQYLDSEGADNGSQYNPGTLEDHWNSDYMKGIRKDLMEGKEIPQCAVCNDKLLNISIIDFFVYLLAIFFKHSRILLI